MIEQFRDVAGNGLLARRGFLRAGVGGAGLLVAAPAITQERITRQALPRLPGAGMSGYGQPAPEMQSLVRERIRSQPGTTGAGASATPLQHLHGTITPSGLHFERHHAGVPKIAAEQHQLVIHGQVKRPLTFSLDDLHRYPMVTATRFLECSGNSATQLSPDALPWNCADMHGLLSNSEWVGVPLRSLLEEAGLPKNTDGLWVIAEGADACRMNRSVPLAKCLDDAIIALYQNGERLRPENGYPMRLFLPGFEGNMSIKWLHQLEVASEPAMSREETSKYTDLRPNGKADGFSFQMAVKSLITSPSPGLELKEPGIYQISGLAWSGSGKVSRVELSADGGKSWAEANFATPPEALAVTRFTAPWRWSGGPATLLSRATDTSGNRQPTRAQWISDNGTAGFYHYNAMQAWQVNEAGKIENIYVS